MITKARKHLTDETMRATCEMETMELYKYMYYFTIFQLPIVIPILFVLCALYLVIAPIVEDPQIQFLYAAIFVVGGLIFYFPLVHFKLISIGNYFT